MRDRSRILAWTQGYAVSKQSSEAWAQRMILARHNLRVLELWAPLPCWILLIQGKIDALVGYQVGKVDLLGGVLLARESGFEVRNPDGSPFPTIAELDSLAVEDQSFVAGPAAIVDLLLEQMNEAESVASMITAGLGTPLESAERSTA